MMMSDEDILTSIRDKEMLITPFDENQPDRTRLTPAGFNFSFTRFIISLDEKMFVRVYDEQEDNNTYLYFDIEPGDTVLALTRESIWVSDCIAGTFHSKVSYVSQGLGHISTTLDPGWMGQLLISINNPSRHKIKVNIGHVTSNNVIYNSFITLCLYKLKTPTSFRSNNTNARLDILYRILEKNDTLRDSKEYKRLLRTINGIRETLDEFYQGQQNYVITNKDHARAFVNNHNVLLRKLDELQPKIDKLT